MLKKFILKYFIKSTYSLMKGAKPWLVALVAVLLGLAANALGIDALGELSNDLLNLLNNE